MRLDRIRRNLAAAYDRLLARFNPSVYAATGLFLDLGTLLRVKTVLGLVERRRARAALDVGCGTGYLSVCLAKRAEHVVATDISLQSVLEARRFARSVGASNVSFAVGDATALPFGAAHFDWVSCTDVVEHIVDDAAALSELAQLVSHGGTLLLTTTSDEHFVDTAEYRDFGHVRTGYRTDGLKGLLRQCGFSVDRLTYFKKPGLTRGVLRISRRAPLVGPLLRRLFAPLLYPLVVVGEAFSRRGYNVCLAARRPDDTCTRPRGPS